ncbi:hypothetical protein QS668_25180 [Escherichia coli]|nr:hypothetical protein [Escherichia coli]
MPAFEWVHVQLHQQKGMISLSPPTICNSANVISVCMLPDNFLFLCGAVMNQCAVPVVSMAVSTIPVITKFDSFRRMFVCIMLSSAWSGVMWFFIRGLMTG